MTEQSKTELRRTHRLSMRLDTLMLIMTLAAIVVAIFAADQNRDAWQKRLSRLETAIGLPRVRNVSHIEVAPMQKENGWSIWVPSGRTVKLRLATEGLDSLNPPIESEHMLKTGRNILRIYRPPIGPSASVSLNSEEIFARSFSRLWNMQLHVGGGYDYKTVHGPFQLLNSFSNVRLKVDEPFDPVKHRSGLRIWIEP